MSVLYRQPIVTVLGHVDSGKTTLLDKIRGTAVQLREAGGITQHIGASLFPRETVENICGPLLRKFDFEMVVPGLLVIDTPGHEVFRNLRARGGSASDIAVVVVDLTKGFQPQTHESLQILVDRKVPFLVAANKIDLIHGWKYQGTLSVVESLPKQESAVRSILVDKLYDIIAPLSSYGFEAERFDQVKDFKRTIALVPVSAVTGEGVREVLTVLVGLVQRFMLKKLEVDYSGPARGTILEVSEQIGFGTVLRAIHVDGLLESGYRLAIASRRGPKVRKIRALLLPAPLDEIRDPRKKFKRVERISPASGIIIASPDTEDVYAGSPFYAFDDETDSSEFLEAIEKEISSIRIETDAEGVIIKADTLGSLEALVEYCGRKSVPLRKTDVGPVSRNDVVEASVVKKMDEFRGAILAFNVDTFPDAKAEADLQKVPIFRGDILYRVVDEYADWASRAHARERERLLSSFVFPGKLEILEGFVFRRSEPAIFGVRVDKGRIKPKYPLVRSDGRKVGKIHQVQEKGESIPEASEGMEVAVSVRGIVVGRDVKEGDILYVDVPSPHAKALFTEFYDDLNADERKALEELAKVKRVSDPLFGY